MPLEIWIGIALAILVFFLFILPLLIKREKRNSSSPFYSADDVVEAIDDALDFDD